MVKFRSDVVGSVNSLGCSKCAFHLISLADGSLLVNEFLPLAFLLNQPDEGLADIRAVGLRFLHLVTCAELIKQAVYQSAAVLQQVGIRWISYLGVTACGVNLHRPAVIVAVLVGVFLLRLAPVCFRQHQGQHVEEVMVESLADKDEQLWNEYRLFRKLLKPKQVLNVGILLNDLDGLLIAQFLHMLHN